MLINITSIAAHPVKRQHQPHSRPHHPHRSQQMLFDEMDALRRERDEAIAERDQASTFLNSTRLSPCTVTDDDFTLDWRFNQTTFRIDERR